MAEEAWAPGRAAQESLSSLDQLGRAARESSLPPLGLGQRGAASLSSLGLGQLGRSSSSSLGLGQLGRSSSSPGEASLSSLGLGQLGQSSSSLAPGQLGRPPQES